MIFSETTLFFAFCATIGLSQSVQLGGAPLINILMMLLIAVPTPYLLIGSLKSTMPILYIILFGGSLVGMIKNFKKTSYSTGKYVIDYDLALVILPIAATGAIFGVLLEIYRLGANQKLTILILSLRHFNNPHDLSGVQVQSKHEVIKPNI